MDEKLECNVNASHREELDNSLDVSQRDKFERTSQQQLVSDATAENDAQIHQSAWEAIKIWKKAMAFSVLLSAAIIMEGYDQALVGNFIAQPAFRRKYGKLTPSGDYQISASWQSAILNGTQIGCMIGLMLTGWANDRFGYKKTLLIALCWLVPSIFIPFFAQNIGTILAGQMLMGIPWGAFQSMSVAYAGEITPVRIRHLLTAYVNLCWIIGQFITAGIMRGFIGRDDQWAYRVPYAIQWVWPIPILVACIFMPESPWWLARKGRLEEAQRSLMSLADNSRFTMEDARKHIQTIILTDQIEKANTAGTSYLDCLKKSDRRRTEIAAATWTFQMYTGGSLAGFATYFFQQAGLSSTNAASLTLGISGVGAIGTMLSWWAVTRIGRRPMYWGGLMIMSAIMAITGVIGVLHQSTATAWTVGALLLLHTFFAQLTTGPVAYIIVGEIPSTRLRAKTIVLGSVAVKVGSIINNCFIPLMLNPSAWNWGPKAGFFWAGFAFLCGLWAFFRLPETKNRSFVELDILFLRGVSARRFSKTTVAISEAVEHQTF